MNRQGEKNFCVIKDDGMGMYCERCGSWKRGKDAPSCPPYVTRSEPDNKRLPHIKTVKQNNAAHRRYFNELDMALRSHASGELS